MRHYKAHLVRQSTTVGAKKKNIFLILKNQKNVLFAALFCRAERQNTFKQLPSRAYGDNLDYFILR